MHTDILTPKDLFQKEVRYTIPPFQRPYVWSQDDQWEPLWEDVRNVAETYLEELERSGNNGVEAEQKTSPHFLGAVVLKQVPTAAKDIDQREVIDGQQRVTTLQLLLDAIQQICEESDQPYLTRAARRLAKLVTNDGGGPEGLSFIPHPSGQAPSTRFPAIPALDQQDLVSFIYHQSESRHGSPHSDMGKSGKYTGKQCLRWTPSVGQD